MKTILAVFENGVFRPTEPVELPENCTVEFEPRVVADEQPAPADPRFAHLDPGMARVYAVLSHRYDGGPPDGAARHNEHQP